MKILIIAFALFGGVLISRLTGLQILQNQRYLDDALAQERIPFKPIAPNRGRILARGPGGHHLVELVTTEPCFEVAVYYPAMDPDQWWISSRRRQIRSQLRRQSGNPKLAVDPETLDRILEEQLADFWTLLSDSSQVPIETLSIGRDRIVQAIRRRILAVDERHGGIDYPIMEQRMYFPLILDLDDDQALDLRAKLVDIPWAVVQPGVRREYLREDTLCHILGRTDRIPGSISTTFTKTEDDYLPGELQGLNGLELAFDDRLRGSRGWLKIEKDEQALETPPIDGEDIVLTIDVALQEYAQERLKQQVKDLPYATGGAVVVLDVQRSELLALVSVPTFKPSEFSEKFRDLIEDNKYLPLFDRSLRGRYAPGSIVKPLVAAWALQQGLVTSTRSFHCRGYYSEQDLPFYKCWLPTGHGNMAMVDAISHSCDIYFYHVGEMLTAEGIADFYRKIGFGRSVPMGLTNAAGRVPSQEWFINHHGRGMSRGDARNLGIGQGDLEITPLQAALMTAMTITGTYQPPRILVDEPLPEARSIGINPNPLRIAREGMYDTVNDPRATGHIVFTPEIKIAAKTGSAQASPRSIAWEMFYDDPDTGERIRKITTNRDEFYRQAPVPRRQIDFRTIESFPVLSAEDRWDEQHNRQRHLSHGWFVGYAPADQPRIVVVVMIEYGLSGGSGGGPVFKDVMLKCKELGYFH